MPVITIWYELYFFKGRERIAVTTTDTWNEAVRLQPKLSAHFMADVHIVKMRKERMIVCCIFSSDPRTFRPIRNPPWKK